MRTFANPAGIRIKNEFSVKIRIQNPMNGVMDKPVTNAGFVNIPWFWVIYFERLISAVPICFVRKLLMKSKDIVQKMQRELGHIFPFFLAAQKFPPRNEQIFHGYDIIINMKKPFNPPPHPPMQSFDSSANQRGIFDMAQYCSAYSQGRALYDRRQN